jgi:hypothetical protein
MTYSDPVTECYRALADESGADTCCKRICVMVSRMKRDGSRMPHELHLMTLSKQLLSTTKSFGRHVLELHAHVDEGNYGAALLVGQAMVEHETMLHGLLDGSMPTRQCALN